MKISKCIKFQWIFAGTIRAQRAGSINSREKLFTFSSDSETSKHLLRSHFYAPSFPLQRWMKILFFSIRRKGSEGKRRRRERNLKVLRQNHLKMHRGNEFWRQTLLRWWCRCQSRLWIAGLWEFCGNFYYAVDIFSCRFIMLMSSSVFCLYELVNLSNTAEWIKRLLSPIKMLRWYSFSNNAD